MTAIIVCLFKNDDIYLLKWRLSSLQLIRKVRLMYENSKKYLRNILNLSDKIQKVLKAKGLNTSKAERIMGVATGTLTKTMERNSWWHSSTEDKFLRSFDVNREWWNSGVGEILDKTGSSQPSDESEKEKIALQTAYKLIDRLESENKILKDELAHYKKGKSKTWLQIKTILPGWLWNQAERHPLLPELFFAFQSNLPKIR